MDLQTWFLKTYQNSFDIFINILITLVMKKISKDKYHPKTEETLMNKLLWINNQIKNLTQDNNINFQVHFNTSLYICS